MTSPRRSRTTGAPPKRRPAGRRATDAPFRIRPARKADVPALVALERIAFTDPWSSVDFTDCIASGLVIFVAVTGDGPVGYIVARHALDEGEILNLGVALPVRRRGVGRALVGRVLETLAATGVAAVFLEVRESNVPAQQLYVAFGFQEVGRRRHYYQRPVEDAVVLRAAISAGGTPA
ncbi:MAG: ribosomal protein S18-alanine N-acetyltransferase [Gemmatimonadales bacterium]